MIIACDGVRVYSCISESYDADYAIAVGRRRRPSSRRSRALNERRPGGGREIAQARDGQLLDGQRDSVAGAARCRWCWCWCRQLEVRSRSDVPVYAANAALLGVSWCVLTPVSCAHTRGAVHLVSPHRLCLWRHSSLRCYLSYLSLTARCTIFKSDYCI